MSPADTSGTPNAAFALPPEVVAAAAQGDPVAMTRVLVSIPSVNPALEEGGQGELEVARQAAAWLEAWGFDTQITEVLPGRANVTGTLGNGGRTLLLNGHLDTVGVAGMTVPPFGGWLRDGRILGRGASDMKAGVAIVLTTAREWARTPGRGRLVVALTCDEEHASEGMQKLVEGGVRADAAVVTEPTSLAVMPAHKGFAWVEIAFRGRAAHGSRPEIGVDAIRHSAALLQELDALEVTLARRSPHPLLGHGSFHAGTIRGGSAWSVYPDACVLTLERRTLPGEPGDGFLGEVEQALKRVMRRIPSLEAALRLDLVRPATEVPVEHPLVQGLLSAAEAEGVAPRVEGMTAWVDAAYLNEAGIPAVCFGPGSIAQAHSTDEWVDEEEIRTGARILSRFTRDFLNGA
ncbi:MAG TPA: M20/M25/M40 family metallo-hydrolase [Longimicrobiales bacterium]|nr:M20/M25/M40 family metallo-hydrolase [Longimicrobiales bacterium]